jgi:seryl-tRNA synthetase
VNGVPHRIDPRNFIREEFQEIQNAGNCNDPRITEDLERLVLRRKRDPVKVNREAGGKNRQVKIDSRERGKTETDRKKIKSFHEGTIQRSYKVKRITRFRLVTFVTSLTSLIICAMLDIRLIREKPDFVRERLAKRGGGDEAKIDDVLRVDVERRQTETALQQLNADRKRLSKEIGGRKSRGESTQELEQRVRGFGEEIGELNTQATAAEKEQNDLLLQIANLPHESVPVGKDAAANRLVRTWGEKPQFTKPADHVVLGTKLTLLDMERAAKLSGSGFICFTGAGAKLERALINFMIDMHTREHGYTEISPPFLVRRDCMVGTSQLPKFEADMYGLEGDQLFLAPTGEVQLTNLHRDEIVSAADLPRKFVAYTPCFRREAGAAGRETRGILRVHQFDKVELVKVTTPEKSYDELESLAADAERVLQLLGLHYRVVELCTGDMGFASAKSYDIEVWSPGQDAYLEVSSCSNCEDFQARRMQLRFRDHDGKNRFCHTLNGSGVALPRLFAALIESYQQPDGSVLIPEKLQSYFGAEKIEMTKHE